MAWFYLQVMEYVCLSFNFQMVWCYRQVKKWSITESVKIRKKEYLLFVLFRVAELLMFFVESSFDSSSTILKLWLRLRLRLRLLILTLYNEKKNFFGRLLLHLHSKYIRSENTQKYIWLLQLLHKKKSLFRLLVHRPRLLLIMGLQLQRSYPVFLRRQKYVPQAKLWILSNAILLSDSQ